MMMMMMMMKMRMMIMRMMMMTMVVVMILTIEFNKGPSNKFPCNLLYTTIIMIDNYVGIIPPRLKVQPAMTVAVANLRCFVRNFEF